jgi:hypothetical protein
MSAPVKMTEIAQAVADAEAIVTLGLGFGDDPLREAAFSIVLRELLHVEVARDLTPEWRPESLSGRREVR